MLTEAEYERQFRPDDWVPPKPDSSSSSKTIVVGVLGVLVILIVVMIMANELGIIGPASERHCLITQSPVPDDEGVSEEIVCVDGNGKELSRETRLPDSDARAIEFGSTDTGESTRVVDMTDFCRGAAAFAELRSGFQKELASATSMVALGGWYDDHDGLGLAGHGTMVGSFGRAGPNHRVVELSTYLGQVRGAARAGTVEQAQMLFAAAEEIYGDHVLEIENFANRNC